MQNVGCEILALTGLIKCNGELWRPASGAGALSSRNLYIGANFSMQALIVIGVVVDPTAIARSAASLVLSARSYPARRQVQRLYAKYGLG
jgi:hypothetical protein